MNAAGLLCLVCVGVLVVAEFRGARGLRALAKCSAAALMVLCAVSGGAMGTAFGRRITLGLCLSAGGDVALLSSTPAAFMAGLSLFLVAHLAYAAAALQAGATVSTALAFASVLFLVARAVWRWLAPHVPSSMRLAVLAYMVVITTMLALAISAGVHGVVPPRFVVGALLFFLSDLAVARDRFVEGSVLNRLWGLPAYFGGQLLIATSI